MAAKKTSLVGSAIKYLCAAAVGAAVSFIASDYVNFREHQRAMITQEMTIFAGTSKEVSLALRGFADKANGEKDAKADTAAFSSLMVRLLDEADSLRNRVPNAESEYKHLADAMVKLKGAATEVTGPLDARPFVESVSEFYVRKAAFERAIVNAQSEYQLPWIGRL